MLCIICNTAEKRHVFLYQTVNQTLQFLASALNDVKPSESFMSDTDDVHSLYPWRQDKKSETWTESLENYCVKK